MRPNFKERIEAIDDEVKELHPLLETILPHVDSRVIKVDYTHGPNEKGADFVVSKTDPAFGINEYVGVIAKKGRIKQNNSDVEQQIRECSWSRNDTNGRPIILSEIWVIATGNITSNARNALYEEYKDKKIKWVDSQLLAQWVNDCYPSYWSNLPIRLGKYLESVREQNALNQNKLALAPSLEEDFYISPILHKIDNSEYNKKRKSRRRRQGTTIEEAVRQDRFVIVEGQMGAGKSKLIQKLTSWHADADVFSDEMMVPISTTYKDLLESYGGSIRRIVNETLDRYQIPSEYRHNILLTIDALDEHQQNEEKRSEQLEQISIELAEESNIRVLLTSRSIIDSTIKEQLSRIAVRYDLAPLTIKQIGDFVESVCKKLNVQDRLLEDLKKSPLFKVLPKTPIAAIILGRLLENNIEDLPANMTELYTRYIELSLGRWDIDKGLQSQKEFEVLKNTTSRIAEYMLDNEMYSIAFDEAKQIGQKYLDNRNLGVDYNELFEKLTNRSDLFFLDTGKGVLAFKHKTFQEYFYAVRMYEKGYPEFSNRAFEYFWMNCNFFYVGLNRDCPEILKKLNDIEVTDDSTRILRLVNLGNFYLAGYLSPYNPISEGIYNVILDGADYFIEVLEDPEHPLSNFSYMQLLAFFRTIFAEGYGYSFFHQAIEDALIQVDTYIEEPKRKAIALFFLEIINAELGGDAVFTHILDSSNPSLPLPVSLAINHEAHYRGLNNSPIRKMEKRIKRSLRADSKQAKIAMENKLEAFYNRPLKSSPAS